MIEKLSAVLDYLRKEKGWRVKAIWKNDQWHVLVEFIETGPWFGYLVQLDNWLLRMPAVTIAAYVEEETLAAMEVLP